MAKHSWANLHWSCVQFSISWLVFLQYQHVKSGSRGPPIPIAGLDKLEDITNCLPPFTMVSTGVFLLPTYRQDIAYQMAVSNCCGLTLVALVVFRFSISFLLQNQLHLSLNFSFLLIAFVLRVGILFCWYFRHSNTICNRFYFLSFVHELNIEMHSAWNCVNVMFWPWVLK